MLNRSIQLLAILTLLLCQSVSVWSQVTANRQTKSVVISSQIENGLERITYATANGNVIATLPAEIAPDDNIWGTVTLAPVGKSSEERTDNFNVLRKLLVEIKPEHGVAIVMAPGCKPKVLHIPSDCAEIQASLYDPDDKSMNTYRLNCLPRKPENNLSSNQAKMPEVATPKRFFRCGANTDGSPGSGACTINGENCPAIAGGPRDQFFAAPNDLSAGPAPMKFYLPDTNQVAESQVSIMRPKIAADKLLKVGDRGQIKISVEGMKSGTNANLIFRNLSPEVISVGGGDYQVIPLSAK